MKNNNSFEKLMPALLFLYLLVSYVLPPAAPIEYKSQLLDDSWQVILTNAFLIGTQFGRDLVFTYGPWGFLNAPRGNLSIYPYLISGRLLIASAFSLGIWEISNRCLRSATLRSMFLGTMVVLGDPIALLPMTLLAVTLIPEHTTNRAIKYFIHLLAIACALCVWVKFTSLVTIGALALALAAGDLIRRRLPVVPIEIFTCSIGFWLLARQSLYVLPQFVAGAISIARSYTDEMFTPGYVKVLAYTLAAAPPMLGLCAVYLLKNRERWKLPLFVFLLIFTFLQLKEAVVRLDSGHIWAGIISSLLPSTLIMACLCLETTKSDELGPIPGLFLRGSIFWGLTVTIALPIFELRHLNKLEDVAQNIKTVLSLPTELPANFHYPAKLREFVEKEPVDTLSGTVSLFPNDEALLYAKGLNVDLPPIPQSYSAYNLYLTSRNAAFYRSKHRPDNVLFEIAAIDNRYPTMEDALTWQALLECYRPSGLSGRYLLLKAAPCSTKSLDLMKEVASSTGKEIPVPPSDGYPVWTEIDIQPKIWERFIALICKPPLTELEIETVDGVKRTFTLSPALANIGFLLSPMILDNHSFVMLTERHELDPKNKVREIKVVQSKVGTMLFSDRFTVRFYSFRLAHSEIGSLGTR